MDKAQEIEKQIKDFLLEGSVFTYILKSNPNLYKDKLELLFKEEMSNSIPYGALNYDFRYDPLSIIFKGDSILKKIKNHKLYEYLYISDFEFNGFLCRNDNDTKINIDATFRVLTSRFISNDSGRDHQAISRQLMPPLIRVLDTNAYEIFDKKDRDKRISEILGELSLI